MIDLHCHILPGIDDGARTIAESVAMARIASDDGVETIVATPHVNHAYPLDVSEIPGRVEEVNRAIQDAGISLTVVPGAEVALVKILEMDRAELRAVSVADGSYLLVEPPHGFLPETLEQAIYDLQLDGFSPLLAHPERCAAFQADRARLEELVNRGVVCSLTASALTGTFGRTVAKFSLELVSRGLVHAVSSDAHGPTSRVPMLTPARAVIGVTGRDPLWQWLTTDVPAAVVSGESSVAARPETATRKRKGRAARGRLPWRRGSQAATGLD